MADPATTMGLQRSGRFPAPPAALPPPDGARPAALAASGTLHGPTGVAARPDNNDQRRVGDAMDALLRPPPSPFSTNDRISVFDLDFSKPRSASGPSKPAAEAIPPLPWPDQEADDPTELSRNHEAKRGPGEVSTGQHDRGGISYGSFQLSTTMKRPQEFMDAEGAPWKARFKNLIPGTSAYSDVWREIARANPRAFYEAQRNYAIRSHYGVQVVLIKRDTGLDVSSRSRAVKNAVFSTAIQHGPHSTIVSDVVKRWRANHPGGEIPDSQLIDAIYAERTRRFPSDKIRYGLERLEAQAMLKGEGGGMR